MRKSKVIEKEQVHFTVEREPESTITSLAQDLDEQEIAALAYELCRARACPEGSPQEDWFRAIGDLQSEK